MSLTPSVLNLTAPPGEPSIAYRLSCYSGELWTIPTSNSTMRLLVTGEETNNAFAVVGTGGTFDKPIGFHYHEKTHDIFLCLKGTLNVWANDKARSMGPGDFASVPPGTIHQYQIASSHTEFVGLIIPGGWEAFFRFIGEPFDGPLFPTHDTRSPFEVLIPKLIAASEQFDMIPVRDKASFDPQPWDGTENSLPGKCANGGYFLKADTGPKFVVGGTVARPLATSKESDGKFSIFNFEASSLHRGRGLEAMTLRFPTTHHAVFATEGVVRITVEGNSVRASEGETVFVPAGRGWTMDADSSWARWYVFANGGGIGEVLTSLGTAYNWAVVPESKDVQPWDKATLSVLSKELGFLVV